MLFKNRYLYKFVRYSFSQSTSLKIKVFDENNAGVQYTKGMYEVHWSREIW